MARIHLQNLEVDGKALLHGTRVFALMLNNDTKIHQNSFVILFYLESQNYFYFYFNFKDS